MFETGQNLALMAEAAQDLFGIHAAFDHFDGNEFVELIVVALRQVHRAHAAAADLAHHAVGAQARAYKGRLFIQHGGGFGMDGRFHHRGAGVIGAQQRFDLGAETRFAIAGSLQERGALRCWQIGCLQEDLFNPVPVVAWHGRS